MTTEITATDESTLDSDLLLRLEFLSWVDALGIDHVEDLLRLVNALGVERMERLLRNVRETLKSPGTIGDPRR